MCRWLIRKPQPFGHAKSESVYGETSQSTTRFFFVVGVDKPAATD
jgi:hypothetical protein